MLLKLSFTAQKWSFPLKISSVNVTKSARNSGFDHIYWKNPSWKTSFFIGCLKFRHVAWILASISNFRYNDRRCFIKIDILENFAKFERKYLYRSLCFNKVSIPRFPCFLLLKFCFDEVTAACTAFLIYVFKAL